MSFWSLDRVAAALGDRQGARHREGNRELAGISTDSRSVAEGQLFVALAGEQFDGHEFVTGAIERGAAAVVVSRDVPVPNAGFPAFRVPDTLVALGQLATFHRRVWGGPVVMVAGSNGKTTTKDLIRAALSPAMKVHATTGNLNNRIGVPLTLLSLPDDAEMAVVEAGTSLPGEIATLRAILDPDISVITSVAEEHLEGLGDLQGVLREEAAAFDGVKIAVTPAAQPEVAEAARARAREVISAGLDEGDVRARSWTLSPDGVGTIELDRIVFRLPLRGIHNMRNAMLAVAIARSCGVADEVSAAGIEAMPAPKMRVAWTELGSATLINDAYNANPGSTRAAIEMIRALGPGRQRVIVLGTMRELGDSSSRYHDELSRVALDSGADVVAGVGDFAGSLERVGGGDPRVVATPDVERLWEILQPRLALDAVILLKASRSVRLERLVPQITTWSDR